MPDSSALYSGQKVGHRFTLIRPLGRGGMGEVWLAQDERLQEPVALKFLPPEVRADPAALDDLRRETAKSHKLTHPNIVRIHDLHEPEGEAAFISMEYVDGWTLTAIRVEQPSRVLSWDYLRPLVQQLCGALDYAHTEHLIHRDLKPGNIMVDSRGRLKLADFGIAATVSDSVSRVSGRHATSGTLPYMSPQQLAGKRPTVVDDIYSLGATVYELLSSKPPFYTGDISLQVLHEPAEPLEERLAGLELDNPVPLDAAALVMACLAKNPAQRPQSARAVAEWIGLDLTPKPSTESLAQAMLPEPESRPAETVGLEPAAALLRSGRTRSKLAIIGTLVTGVAFGLTGALLLLFWPGLSMKLGLNRAGKSAQTVQEGDPGSGTLTNTSSHPVAESALADHPVVPAQPSNEEVGGDRSFGTVAATGPGNSSSLPSAESGFVSLFNGRDLTGWDGDPAVWSMKDGAINARATTRGSYLLTRKDLVVGDFELRLSCRLVGDNATSEDAGNIGVRSRCHMDAIPPVIGYQMDFGVNAKPNREIFGGPPRGILAKTGQKVLAQSGGDKGTLQVVGLVSTPDEIDAVFKPNGWNELTVIAQGNHLIHKINGLVAAEVTDEDEAHRSLSGQLALKLWCYNGPIAAAQIKDIRLKQLPATTTASASTGAPATRWIPLFDGKTLSGWTSPDQSDWRVAADGSVTAEGPCSHLFSPNTYANLELKAEIKLASDANCSLGFRAQRRTGVPTCYMAKANLDNKHPLTGSLFKITHPNQRYKQELPVRITEQLARPNVWFTEDIIAIGNRIVVRVNNRIIADYVDREGPLLSGHLVIEQWHPGAAVACRNAMVKPLPDDSAAAWMEARKDMPDLKP